jgi:HTH-type transcriptional regulator/antitoxin HipB
MMYPIRTSYQLRPILIGLRKKAGLSQTNVAAQLGITQQSYAKIEANPTATSFERLYTIMRLLGGELYLATHGDDADAPGKAPAPPAPQPGKSAPPTQTPSNKEVW